MNKTKKKESSVEIEVMEIQVATVNFCVLGTSPLIINRLAEKARQELLLPAGRKNEAEKKSSLKHDPIAEFRSSLYRKFDNSEPYRCYMPGGAFSRAIASAALDLPGASKAQIERLVKVEEINVGIYGLPRLFLAVVRQSDINRTPDIRTRAIFPRWAAYLSVRFVKNLVNERTVANLLAGAGIIVGIGDHRGQKSGSYGAFRLVNRDDKDFNEIVRNEAREAQDEAIEQAIPYEAESEELLGWFMTEAVKREKVITKASNGHRPSGTITPQQVASRNRIKEYAK